MTTSYDHHQSEEKLATGVESTAKENLAGHASPEAAKNSPSQLPTLDNNNNMNSAKTTSQRLRLALTTAAAHEDELDEDDERRRSSQASSMSLFSQSIQLKHQSWLKSRNLLIALAVIIVVVIIFIAILIWEPWKK